MPGLHASGTQGVLASYELNRDVAGLQGTYGWTVQSGAVTFSSVLTFNVAAIAAGDYTVNGASGAIYAGGTVAVGTQDPTNPRVDLIVVTAAGAVSVVAGTPAALTATSGPVPTAPSATQLEIARIWVPASGTGLGAGDITDRRVPLAANTPVRNYKTATQTVSASTTFADITGAAAATFLTPVVASGVYMIEYHLPVTFTSTGGVKFQLTGPSAPTAVTTTGWNVLIGSGDATDNSASEGMQAVAPTSGFSTGIAAANAAATLAPVSVGSYYISTTKNAIHLYAVIVNGVNAGNVTLQIAQNSAAGTAVLGIGAWMRAERIA